jgi:hypothetical protein
MTLTPNVLRNEYTALASQTIFNYTFKIFAATELNVYITEAGDDGDDGADIISTFTVDPATIGDAGGGFITLDSGASAGQLLTIVANLPRSRIVNYLTNGDFIPATVNQDIDRAVSIAKQAEELANRSVVLQRSQQLTKPLSLPAPVPGFYLRWNSISTGLENATAPSVVTPSEVVGNVADMIANVGLVVGQFVWTTGYITEGDRGSNMYEIVAAATGTDDGGSFIDLSGSGHQAKGLFVTAFINVKQFGATGDGSTDDTTAFVNTVAFAPNNSIVLAPYPDVSYELTGMTISKPITIRGENFSPVSHVASGILFTIESSGVLIEQFDITRVSGSSSTFKVDSTVNRDNIIIRDIKADLSSAFFVDSNSSGNITNLSIYNISSSRQLNNGITIIDATDNLNVYNNWISYVSSPVASNSTAFDISNALSGNIYNNVGYGLVTETTAHVGYSFTSLTNLKITNLFANGFGNEAYIVSLSVIEMINWSSVDCKGEGLIIGLSSDCKLLACKFIAHASVAATTNGILINNSSSDISITACHVEDYSKDGINTLSPRLKVSDSYLVNNGGYGIRGETGSGFSVVNCDIQGNTLGDIFKNAAAPQNDFASYNTFDSGIIQGKNIFQKTTTMATTATADFPLNPAYKRHRFWINNLVPNTDDVGLTFLVFIDGGTTPITGANSYHWTYACLVGAVEVNGHDNFDADIDLIPSGASQGIGSGSNEDGLCGYIDIYDPGNATRQKMITWNLGYIAAAGEQCTCVGSARIQVDDDWTDVRFLMDSGSMEIGTILHEGST